MPLLLSILALLAAGVAILLAWRSSRAAHRLALEMVQLRDRLEAAEQHYEDAAEAAAHQVPAAPAFDPTVAPRLDAMEERLRGALEREAEPVPSAAEADPHAVIRRYFLSEGYTHVTLLEEDGESCVLVEAEREGVIQKGRAALDEEGRVQWRPVSNLRAFP